MRILVCGGRKYSGYDNVSQVIDAYIYDTLGDYDYSKITIIEGGANGADALGNRFGRARGCKVETFPAQWGKYGKSAGFIRNKQMLDEGKPDLVIAFPGGKGTTMMVDIAIKAGVKVVLVNE